MIDKDTNAIVCMKLGGRGKVVRGADTRTCQECGATVWVSLTGQKVLKEEPERVIVCMDCARPILKQHPEKGEIRADMIKELLDNLTSMPHTPHSPTSDRFSSE